jgi:tetratricopeptide (TPR) repeat protein
LALLAVVAWAGLLAPAAPEPGQLDASPSLFAVMAAINAAGYDADLDSPANDPLRALVRREVAARRPPSLAALREFFEQHRQKDWTEEVSQYISFALCVHGPPDFKYRFLLNQLPPDVFALQGLEKLMARFYREAELDQLWRKAQPYYERVIARYHEPVSRAVLEANAYVRSPTSGVLGRRFQIWVELLAAPRQVHVRNYQNDYIVVVTPAPEPQIAEIRHAYLHYLADPMVLRSAEELNRRKPLIDFALGAPLLPEIYKKDFLLLASKCLVKAMEARLAPPSLRQTLVEQALREGYILTPYFAEALPAYEKQEQALRFYFPEMVKGIDLRRETQRLDQVEFARQARAAPAPGAEARPAPSGPEGRLEEAEQWYAQRELDKARQAFLQVLRESDQKRLHARAYYGLARIAALMKDPELAERLFQRTLECEPDPQTAGWTHVYLARLAEAAGEEERARGHYQAALALPGASAAARAAAEKALAGGGASGRPRPPE